MKTVKTMFGAKLLRQDLRSINGKFQYRFDKWLEVPGNGSYVAVSGGLDAGGLGPVAVAVECDIGSEVFPIKVPPEGVMCFGRVRIRRLESCAKRLPRRLLAAARRLSKDVVTSPQAAYSYAICVLKGRFPAGEAAIATNANESYYYARDVLNGRFPAGEAVIAKDAGLSYCYAKDVVKGRFPEGEAAIAKEAGWACWYAYDVLKGRFPEGEAAIATNARSSYYYARDVLKGRFSAGETPIAKSAYYSDLYRKEFGSF